MNEQPKFNIKLTNVEDGKRETWEESEVNALMRGFSSHREENEMEKDYFFRENFNKALKLVQKLAENYGVKGAVVSPKMVHVLPHQDYAKISSETGACCIGRTIIIDEKYYKMWDDLVKFMVFCHELLHANSYQSMLREKIINKEFKIKNMRLGVFVRKADSGDFKGFNEAITVFLTNDIYFHDVNEKLEFSRNKPKPAENIEIQSLGDRFDHYRSLEKLFMDICEKISNTPTIDKEDKEKNRVIPVFIEVYFKGGIDRVAKLLMKLGSGALNNLARINDKKDKDNLMRIVNFRKKYGLPEDAELNKYIATLKK